MRVFSPPGVSSEDLCSYSVPMRPRLVRDQSDRDLMTLRRVIDSRLTMVAECHNCRRLTEIDALDMVDRLGAATTIGELRKKCRCRVCGKSEPLVLMREPGVRGEKAWWPHPPARR